jgi:hypothetical protein
MTMAQCPLGTPFRTSDASALVEGVRTLVEDRIYAGEYHSISNIVATNTYTIDICGLSEDTELTIYDATDTQIGFSTADCGNDGTVTFMAPNSGTYKAQINLNACGTDNVSKSVWATLDIALGINDNSISKFQIYPNPVTDHVNIDLGNNHQAISFSIMNIDGKMVKLVKLFDVESTKIDLSNLSSGIYFMEIQTDNVTQVTKLIKQ